MTPFMQVTFILSLVIGYCHCAFELKTDDEHSGVEGGSVELKCTYRNPPQSYNGPTIIVWNRPRDDFDVLVMSWYSGTGTPTIGDLYADRVSLQGNDASIDINDLTVSDSDTYRCSVDFIFALQSAMVETRLSVLVPVKSKPTINGMIHGGTITLTNGKEATLNCEVFGTFPSATFQWIVGGIPQTPGYETSTENYGLFDTTSTITYTPRWKNDQGQNITCIVTNVATMLPYASSLFMDLLVPVTSRPSINGMNHSETITLTRDEQATLNSEVFGTRPPASFQWIVGGIPQTPGDETSTENDGLFDTTSTITYTPHWKIDQGQNITCIATNLATISPYASSLFMDLLVPPAYVTIKDYNDGDYFSVNEGQLTSLTCSSTAKPAPSLAWFIDNVQHNVQSTTPEPNPEDSELFDRSSTFSFTPRWMNHLNWVKCVANGNVFSQVKLDVLVPAKHVLISDENKNDGYATNDSVIVVDNLQHTLTCETAGTKPNATIDWKFFGIPVHTGGTTSSINSTDSRLFDTTRTITLTPSWSYHGKNVSCEGKNSANSEEVSTYINLDVQVSPSTIILQKSQTGDLQVIDGKQITVKCNAFRARPASFIQWTLDGRYINGAEDVTENEQDRRLQDTKGILLLTPVYELDQRL
ncbi:nephrin-like [Ptychodera flava]|uniref:nephrin-like n=1 Tax=Ptychodera flava TaxID=63121 RepID=UPI00396A2AE6